MVPLTFNKWVGEHSCIGTTTDKFSDGELEDIVKRHMRMKTDKGLYRILSIREEFSATKDNGIVLRGYEMIVEPIET